MVREALRLPEFDALLAQGHMKPEPRASHRPPDKAGEARQGAVLLLLYPRQEQLHLVLTRRRDDLNSHAGQISFPGGRREPGETLQEAALREAQEEIGLHPAGVTLLGELSSLYILPSDFEVHPFVGWHDPAPLFVPQTAEVAEILQVPLSLLLRGDVREREVWQWRGFPLEVPFFRVGEHKVWGATAMMLSEFVERLRAVAEDGFPGRPQL
jgi:8-oxo-dGTP pyrophosphatase MutT (NUDIX family)